jgi:hypothetical protein
VGPSVPPFTLVGAMYGTELLYFPELSGARKSRREGFRWRKHSTKQGPGGSPNLLGNFMTVDHRDVGEPTTKATPLMKRFGPALLIIIEVATAVPLLGQRIESQASNRGQVVHLKTALNHLTVIELREPVIQVATGSQSFKVEWRENKVFVQPTEPDACTNLFIWTASERLNYELEPAGAVASMDFPVDQMPAIQPKPASVTPPQPSPTEVLLAGKPVRLQSAKPSRKLVEVVIRDLYEGDGRLLIRYAVRNRGSHAYEITTPQVYALTGVRYPQSLYSLVDSQLGDQEAAHLTIKEQSLVRVLEDHVQSSHLVPGQESLGVVAVQPPSTTEPTVLRFQFANDDREQVTAFLVR